MLLTLKRYSCSYERGGSTQGLLFVDGKFLCHTLEDEIRDEKVYGETCIPEGKYKITLANWGSMNDKYKERYPLMHEGMLILNSVPKFEGILIHQGVTDKHTEGCILVGNGINNNQMNTGTLLDSAIAYQNLYKKVIDGMDNEEVWIEVIRMEGAVL